MRVFTTIELEKLKAEGKIRGFTETKRKEPASEKESKYRNRKTEVDGIVFDSAKEATRYKQLKLMRKAGQIGLIERQVPFELNTGGTHSLKYVADFLYMETATGRVIVEDVKGFRTAIYKKKKRLMKKVHGIEIKEV